MSGKGSAEGGMEKASMQQCNQLLEQWLVSIVWCSDDLWAPLLEVKSAGESPAKTDCGNQSRMYPREALKP